MYPGHDIDLTGSRDVIGHVIAHRVGVNGGWSTNRKPHTASRMVTPGLEKT